MRPHYIVVYLSLQGWLQSVESGFHSGNKPLSHLKQVSLFVNRNNFFTLKIESKGISKAKADNRRLHVPFLFLRKSLA